MMERAVEMLMQALLIMGYLSPDAKPSHQHSEFRALDELVVYNKF